MKSESLAQAVGDLRPTLLRIARVQLRNDTWAEDAVSETLISALEGVDRFGGQSQLKTWVIGILKHKIIDQFRRAGREISIEAATEAAQVETFDELYTSDEHRVNQPLDWGDPEAAYSRVQFFDILQLCVEELPPALARVFMMREWLELDTPQICKEVGITATNSFVMLHRARMRLRECLELRWFATEAAAR
jgi:RNA polymerase sigma-70 factor (ECF subfamily)